MFRTVHRLPSTVYRAAAAVLSGLLLAASYAPFEKADLAWGALIPLLVAARFVEGKAAFRLGFLAGAVFWICSIFWLRQVTWLGMVTLALYCSLYIGAFTWGCSAWLKRFGSERFMPNIGFILFASTLWVALEYVRSNFLTGFPWNGLAISQYRNLALIQVCAFGGTYLLSGLIVWVSSSVAITVLGYVERRGRWHRRPHGELFAGLVVLVVAFTWGWRHVRAMQPGDVPLRASLIQPNIPQDEKWNQEKIDLIYQRLYELTITALRSAQPDLLVWPETALPDDIRTSETSSLLVVDIVTNGAPLLVGSMDTVWGLDGVPVYYNCAFLFDRDGSLVERYDKQHLVMFGEYVPLRNVLPFIKALTPIGESFSPGHTGTVFRLASPDVAFSVLICFEDAFAGVARGMVRNGARLLVNQTNDGWFDPSSGSRQHMAHSVFRCVENGVPIIRCANTGVSCAIDRSGRITDVLLGEDGDPRIHGFMTVEVDVPSHVEPTPYTRHGDVFAWGCLVVAGGTMLLLRRFNVQHSTLNSQRPTQAAEP